MANFLSIFKGGRSSGMIDIGRRRPDELRQIISEGADLILRQRRHPHFPQMDYSGPRENVQVVRNQMQLELFLASVVAIGAREQRWGQHEFYYPCMEVDRIGESSAWQALVSGTYRHNVEPMLTYERDIHCFDNMDWLLCTVLLCLR